MMHQQFSTDSAPQRRAPATPRSTDAEHRDLHSDIASWAISCSPVLRIAGAGTDYIEIVIVVPRAIDLNTTTS